MKLGNYLYADACPHCKKGLEHNTKVFDAPRVKDPKRVRSWPIRCFFGIVKLIES